MYKIPGIIWWSLVGNKIDVYLDSIEYAMHLV